jgi:hypothetical protein
MAQPRCGLQFRILKVRDTLQREKTVETGWGGLVASRSTRFQPGVNETGPGCRNIGGGPAVRVSEVIERLVRVVPSIADFHDQW